MGPREKGTRMKGTRVGRRKYDRDIERLLGVVTWREHVVAALPVLLKLGVVVGIFGFFIFSDPVRRGEFLEALSGKRANLSFTLVKGGV